MQNAQNTPSARMSTVYLRKERHFIIQKYMDILYNRGPRCGHTSSIDKELEIGNSV